MPYFLSLYGVKAFDLGSARLPLPLTTNGSDLAMPMRCQCLILHGLQCNILVSMSLSLLSLMQYLDFNTSLHPRAPSFLDSNLSEFYSHLLSTSISSLI